MFVREHQGLVDSAAGNAYVVDEGIFRIQKLSSYGIFMKVESLG
jgi:hypothetical protein